MKNTYFPGTYQIQYKSNIDSEGRLTSHGIEYYRNGCKKFDGVFRHGLYHGSQSKLYYKDGILQYSGTFLNGSYHGYGKLYDKHGHKFIEGFFEDNEFSGKFGKSYYPETESIMCIGVYKGKGHSAKFNIGSAYHPNGRLLTSRLNDHAIRYNIDGSVLSYRL